MKVEIANYVTRENHEYKPGDVVKIGDNNAKKELLEATVHELILAGLAREIEDDSETEDSKKVTPKAE